MRKIVLISVFILCITNNVVAQESYQDELIDIATIVLENDMSVDSWQVIIKEKMNKDQIGLLVDELKDSYLVTRTEDENSIKYSFEDVHKNGVVYERFNAILPKNTSHNAELIAVLEGDSWNSKIEDNYQEKINWIQKQYFTKSAQIYPCLTTSDNAIINSDYFLSNFTEKMDVKHIQEQTDTELADRKIIYGYTSQWGRKMTIVDKPVNVQIVVENMDEHNKSYTIGTPILINEY
ncbi:TATA-box binding [Oceanobacillus limi]|uniref:TATA-box binding n=1 Tax=Oceanobacillus limi TaxID=930131 RepID=A0A1I0G4X6_9BACI|nr:YwmB family TATA-box binding protein [Oceanobacillus limi]SET65802.1 TATA-box binding [Oceanobacillus limi]